MKEIPLTKDKEVKASVRLIKWKNKMNGRGLNWDKITYRDVIELSSEKLI